MRDQPYRYALGDEAGEKCENGRPQLVWTDSGESDAVGVRV
jgi:hypothetical protein